MQISKNLSNLIKVISVLSKEIILQFFPLINISEDLEDNQVIMSNGLSNIYIEHLDNIFHLSAFDQMYQEQKFCIEIDTENNIVDEEIIIEEFKKELSNYLQSICVGILKINYQNISSKIINLVKSHNGKFLPKSDYDFCVEKLDINILLNNKIYLIESEFRSYGGLSGGIYFKPLGSAILTTEKKSDSIVIINTFLSEIIKYIENDINEDNTY